MEDRFKYDVFLSASKKDKQFVKPLYRKMKKKGLKVFWAEETLKVKTGKSWFRLIEESLMKSRNFVLVCSPPSVESEWVQAEYETFHNECYIQNKTERKLFILKGKNFHMSLVPNLLKRLQIAEVIDEIIDSVYPPLGDAISSEARAPELEKPWIKRFWPVILVPLLITALFFLIFKTGEKDLKKLRVTNLTFIDVPKKCPIENKKTAGLINQAVTNGMRMGIEANAHLTINQPGYEIPTMNQYTLELADILFDNLPVSDRLAMVINRIMVPMNTDIIISGYYTNDTKNSMIKLRPLIINRYHKKKVDRNLEFPKPGFLCQNLESKRKKIILCPDVNKEIVQTVQELLEQLGHDKLYVTHLNFMYVPTQSNKRNKEMEKLINGAVKKGMKTAVPPCQLMINDPGHNIPNTDENLTDLASITSDPNLTNKDKIKRIINEIMDLYHVDVIVTGQYLEIAKTDAIIIRPFVILKYDKDILAKNLEFTLSELFCQDALTHRKTLCPEVYDQIARAVQELLDEV